MALHIDKVTATTEAEAIPVAVEAHLGPSDEETDAEQTDAQRWEAAGKLIEEGEEADEVDDEAAAAAQDKPAKGEPPEPAEAQETPAEPEGPTAADLLQQQIALRRQAKQMRDESRRVQEQLAELKAQQDSVAEREKRLGELFRTDPEGALAEAAKLAGTTTDAYYERLTRQRLNDGEPDAAAAYQETQVLHAKLAELEKSIAEREQQRDRQHAEEQQQSAYQSNVAELCGVRGLADNAAARERWAYAMGLPEDDLAIEARAVAAVAMKQAGGRGLSADELAYAMDQINEVAKRRYEAQHNFISGPALAAEDQDTSEPEREPEPTKSERAAKPSGKSPRTTTNKDAATGGTGRREPEPGTNEWFEHAGELMGDNPEN